jgi:uncharacterized protein (DUF488 family)
VNGVATIYTIGHSNLGAEAFFDRLAAAGVGGLADVRAFPGSRRHPQFGREALETSCRAHDFAYRWMPALGGRRRAAAMASPHVAWQVPAFRHFADYTDTAEFAAALGDLMQVASILPTAILCAEALWWQCHRRLIADRLLVAGWQVLHVGAWAKPAAHQLPDFARLVDGRIVYDVGVTAPLALPTTRDE